MNREMPTVQVIGAIYPDEMEVLREIVNDQVTVDGERILSARMLIRTAIRHLSRELGYGMPPQFTHDTVIKELPKG